MNINDYDNEKEKDLKEKSINSFYSFDDYSKLVTLLFPSFFKENQDYFDQELNHTFVESDLVFLIKGKKKSTKFITMLYI